jgi:hypothetical protein
MRIVKASNGNYFFIIDNEDYERVIAHNWTYRKNDGYFVGNPNGCHESPVLLHRFILGYDGSLDIDHIDRWPWNNQKANLRIATRTVNNLNRVSGLVKERQLASGRKVYDARIQVFGKSIHLGTFSTYKRAKILAERARRDVIAGETSVTAIKRPQRWSKTNRQQINLENAA